MRKNKCVFVVGPESSGSMLVAKIIAHVLNIKQFNDWNGVGECYYGENKVIHRSLPYGIPPQYPNIDEWIENHQNDFEMFFIVTTRDRTISEMSRMERFNKTLAQVNQESQNAIDIINYLFNTNINLFIWSYETFILINKVYLNLLFQFIGTDNFFSPELVDANHIRIQYLINSKSFKYRIKKRFETFNKHNFYWLKGVYYKVSRILFKKIR